MLQDLRFAFRTLLRAPGFTAMAGLTLALGIGATSLMFSVVNAVLLRPLPYPEQSRLILLFNLRTNAPSADTIRLTPLDFNDYKSGARSFESLAGYVGKGFTLSGAGEPELVIGEMVTAEFFRTLGVAPALGRTFASDEFQLGRENVVVLSERLWKRRSAATQHRLAGALLSMANRRRDAGVSASYTTPMPPLPSGAVISYGPRRVPGDRANGEKRIDYRLNPTGDAERGVDRVVSDRRDAGAVGAILFFVAGKK